MPTPTLRVITFNIQLGWRLGAVADVLGAHSADVVCLQEVTVRSPVPPSDHAAFLAERLGLARVSLPVWPLKDVIVGLAILVRGQARHGGVLYDRQGRPFALAAEVEVNGQRAAVCCMHLRSLTAPLPVGFFRTMPTRVGQARRVAAWARAQTQPVIVAGDTNTLAGSPEYRTIARRLHDCSRLAGTRRHATRPTWGVPIQLDRIFVSSQWKVLACDVIDADASDHKPLTATLAAS